MADFDEADAGDGLLALRDGLADGTRHLIETFSTAHVYNDQGAD
jgi:hypothetical protein